MPKSPRQKEILSLNYMNPEICTADPIPKNWDVLEMGCPRSPMSTLESVLTGLMLIVLTIYFAAAYSRQE